MESVNAAQAKARSIAIKRGREGGQNLNIVSHNVCLVCKKRTDGLASVAVVFVKKEGGMEGRKERGKEEG